jgi:prevent-host-death family protein
MNVVGLRELKNRLSEYVSRVKSGHTVVGTDRGRAVAELRPISTESRHGLPRLSLDDLVRAGLLTPGKPDEPGVYPLMRPVGRRSSTELLAEELKSAGTDDGVCGIERRACMAARRIKRQVGAVHIQESRTP